MHYTRLKRHGDPLKVVLPQRKQRGICTVDGCDNLDCGLNGLCQKHSARLKRHGDPLVTMRERFPHQWYRDNPDEAVWWHRERRNQEARESTARLSESGKQYRKEMHRRRKARQNAMVVNPRAGAWTPAEDAIVVREDISVTEIAFLLQRSYGAACGRRTVLRRYASGTVAPHPFHPLWTPAEDAVVMREDITVTEMCCLTGRSRRGVRARRRRLGQQYKDD
jgi:hypothetical protein